MAAVICREVRVLIDLNSMKNNCKPFSLSDEQLACIRKVAVEVRILKENNYESMTWEEAKVQVARKVTDSQEDYYAALALLGYFVNEKASLTSLEMFLLDVPKMAQELRERDSDYAIDATTCASIRTKIDAFLCRAGEPTTPNSAFEYYHVLIDRIFTCTALSDLLDTIDRLSSVLVKWYPNAFIEAQILAANRLALECFFCEAATPISLAEASKKQNRDLTDLRNILHRFVAIGILSKSKSGREVKYHHETSVIDTNKLRKQWDWLWCQPGQRLSLKFYEVNDVLDER